MLARLKAEAPPAWSRLNDEYSKRTYRINWQAGYELTKDKAGMERPKLAGSFVCVNAGNARLIDGNISFSSKEPSRRDAVGKNHAYFFAIRGREGGFLLERTGQVPSQACDDEFLQWVNFVSPATSISCPTPIQLSELLYDPEYKIERVVLADATLQIHFRTSSPLVTGQRPLRLGVVQLDARHQWRVVGYEYRREAEQFTATVRLRYKSGADGIDFIESWKQETVAPHGKTTLAANYDEFRLTTDRAQFYLSHYGLPEPPGVTPPSRPTPTYVWLLLAAVGFGGITLGCRWLLKRRAKSVPPTPPPVV